MVRPWVTALALLLIILNGCVIDFQRPHPVESPKKDEVIADQHELDCTGFSVAFSTDGRFLASGDVSVCLWDVETGQLLQIFQTQQVEGSPWQYRPIMVAMALSPDNTTIVAGVYDGILRVWDRSSGSLVRLLKGHAGGIRSVAYSPDGRYIASGSHDKTVRIWDATTGEQLRALEGHNGWTESVNFSPDGRLIVSGSTDGTARLWETETGKLIGEVDVLKSERSGIRFAGFGPDGRTIHLVGFDGSIGLWDFETGHQRVLSVKKDALAGFPADMSRDGTLIIAGGQDGRIGLLRGDSGKEMTVFQEGDREVRGVAFGPDGKHFASVGYDGELRLWNIHKPEPERIFNTRFGSGLETQKATGKNDEVLADTSSLSPGTFREALFNAAKECAGLPAGRKERIFPQVSEGQWTIVDRGKKFLTGGCHNGKAEGTWFIIHDHGAKAVEAHFHEGTAEGLWRYWHYDGGLIIEEEYKYGLWNGRKTWWYKDNGVKMRSGTYKDGKMDGKWVYWDHDGNLEKEEMWNDDRRISP